MKKGLEDAASVVLTVCAVLVTAFFIRGQLRRNTSGDKPSRVADWNELLSNGVRSGPSTAALQVVVFSDFQCPFCRVLFQSLDSVGAEYRDLVSTTYYHYPLAYHEAAIPAAVAAECAHRQNRFWQFSKLLFNKQDSLGSSSWVGLASQSRVPDLQSYERCLGDSAVSSLISHHRELGRRLHIAGTPTVIINGWKLPRPPTTADLVDYARRAKKGDPLHF